MAILSMPVHAIRLADDWLGPAASLDGLLGKLARASASVSVLGPGDLGVPADHFAWLKTPQAVIGDLAEKSFPISSLSTEN